MDEHEFEPVPGLPEDLPAGERILWQGAPSARALAFSVFHLRALTVYFVVLLALRGIVAYGGGASVVDATLKALMLAPLAIAALALLGLFAWLMARTTIYTITTKRVVMRFGVALPLTVNVPFRIIEAADLKVAADGTGDIPLTLSGPDRIAYLHLWPHARPRRYARPQPMLRAVPDAQRAAGVLVQALGGAAPSRAPTAAPASPELEPALPDAAGT